MLPSSPEPSHRRVRYNLVADAEPGLLPRVLGPFARRDLIPDHVRARRGRAGLSVEIVLAAMPVEMIGLVEGNLRQIVGVRRLEVVLFGARQAGYGDLALAS